MGSGASQEKIAVEDNSDSFHILELHMPTLGVGILCLIIIILVAIAVWCIRKRKLKKFLRHRAPPSTYVPNNIFNASPLAPDNANYIPMSPLSASLPSLPTNLPPPPPNPYATLNPRHAPSSAPPLYPSVPRESHVNLTLDPQALRDFFRPHRRSLQLDDKPPSKDERWPFM
jgi:hypothetical protein